MPSKPTISMDDDGLPHYSSIVGAFFAFIGFLCLLGSNFWCSYATQDVTVTAQENQDVYKAMQLRSGIWNYEGYKVWMSTDGDNVYTTIYRYCVPYTGVEFDSLWKSAMAFTILAAIIGGIAAIGSCCVFCVSPSRMIARILALLVLFATLFQGLTFLYFSSNGCRGGPTTLTGQDGNRFNLSWSGECAPSHAAKLGISSVVFWFVGAVFMVWFVKVGFDQEEAPDAGTAKSSETKKSHDDAPAAEESAEISA